MGQAVLLEEHLAPQLALQIGAAQLLASRQSRYQRIDVYDSPAFGRLFRLDGVLMSSEADEFYYHETLVHPALLSQSRPQRVLVLGGGDGGSARQALKHGSVQRIDVVELDAEVVALARQYLPGVHGGAFDDPRVVLHIGDGKDFVSACRETYELIVLDLTDPVGAAAPLYTPAFFAEAARCLSPGGCLTLHLGSPVYALQQVVALQAALRQVFPLLRLMLLPIPSYGGLWALAVASWTTDVAGFGQDQINQRLLDSKISDLRYYNAEIHHALLALPGFLRRALS